MGTSYLRMADGSLQTLTTQPGFSTLTFQCEICGAEVVRQLSMNKKLKYRFCGTSCSAKWRMAQPEIREAVFTEERSRKLSVAITGTKNPKMSEYRKIHNPMFDPIHREKMRLALTGRPFPTARGGNGHLTFTQKLLASLTGLIMEHPVSTKSINKQFERLPTCYKVDLASVDHQVAIEIDGKSHKIPKIKALDEKKEIALKALGWSVLRFSNEEIINAAPDVVERINSHITSKNNNGII